MNFNINDPEIDKLVSGDDKTYEQLYQKLFPKVVTYVKKNKGTLIDAEEVFHKSLFQIIVKAKTIGGIQIKSSFHGYIFGVCRNRWLMELKDRKRKNEIVDSNIYELAVAEEDIIKNIIEGEKWALFQEKFELLSENCSALLKDFFNKVPYNIITKKFNYSNENVTFQRVFKCKKKLADLIKADPNYKDLSL